MPDGTTVSSVLKTVGKELTNKTIDLRNNEIKDVNGTGCQRTKKRLKIPSKLWAVKTGKPWIQALVDADVFE